MTRAAKYPCIVCFHLDPLGLKKNVFSWFPGTVKLALLSACGLAYEKHHVRTVSCISELIRRFLKDPSNRMEMDRAYHPLKAMPHNKTTRVPYPHSNYDFQWEQLLSHLEKSRFIHHLLHLLANIGGCSWTAAKNTLYYECVKSLDNYLTTPSITQS